MMLRGEHDVFGSGALEHVRPMIRIEELGTEHRREILVGKVGAIDALVESPGGGTGGAGREFFPARDGVPIPLRVLLLLRYAGSRIAGHRIDAPVNKDAEFRVAAPRRR